MKLRLVTLDRVLLIRVGGLAGLTLLAAIFFRPVFQTWSFFVPPLVGAVLAAAALALLADRLALGNGWAATVQTIGMILVVPGLISLDEAKFGLPVPAAIGALIRAIIHGPVSLLTSPIPAESKRELLVVPILAAWAGLSIGWLFARRSHPVLSVVGPVITLVAAIAFGPLEQSALRVAGFGFLLGAFLYLLLLDRLTGMKSLVPQSRLAGVRRAVPGLFTILPVAVLGCVIGPSLPFAASHERFTLRKYRVPPFDASALSSPLADYAKYLTGSYQNKELFDATGDLPDRWRLAVLNAYDGRVWSVGGNDTQTGRFELVGAKLDSDRFVGAKSPNKSAVKRTSITIKDLGAPWLPMPGKGEAIDLPAGPRSRIRHNRLTDDVVWTEASTIAPPYTLDWRPLSFKTPQQLGKIVAESGPGDNLGLPELPPKIANFARDNATAGLSASEQAIHLQSTLKNGFYDKNSRPGHAYGDLESLLGVPSRMVGNDEQYVAAFAVLARALELPVRVVVGFVPPAPTGASHATVRVYGRDIRAWAEVRFAGAGWVPFTDIVPPFDRRPEPKLGQNEKQIDSPPPPVDPTPQPLDEQNSQAPAPKRPAVKGKASTSSFDVPVAVKIAGAVTLMPLLTAGLFLGAVGALKSRRRRRRRNALSPSLQIAGAWDEVLDRLEETGRFIPIGTTFAELEDAVGDESQERSSLIAEIGSMAEQSAFRADAPTDTEAQKTWGGVDELRRSLVGGQTRLRRMRYVANLRSLTSKRSPRLLRQTP